MSELKEVDGQVFIDLFKTMGIEDWQAIQDVIVEIKPPGLIQVSRALRNEHGQFYRDPDGSGDPAREVHAALIRWPDAH